MEAANRPTLAGVGAVAATAAATVLLAWALFAGGASGTTATASLGTAAVLLAAAAVVAWAFGALHLPQLERAGAVAATAAVALVVWAALGLSWTIAGDRTWDAVAKGVVLLAFGVVGLAVAAQPGRQLRLLALVLAALLAAVLVWALLGKAVPALGPEDAGRAARLKGSIGYWNALALLADAGLGLALWLLVSVRERLARPAGALLFYAATLVVLLTQSRSGVLGALVVVAVGLCLSESRLEAALLGLLAGLPGAVVAGWAFTRPALVQDGGARADRVADGAVLGVLSVAGAAVVLVLLTVVPVSRLVATRRREVARLLGAAMIGVAVVAVLALVLSVGNPVTWARGQVGGSGEVANDPGRLGSLETNNRTVWWGEAWRVFRAHPAGGTGARTFEIARKRVRDTAQNVTEPHSVPLQLLSDGGLPAFALGLTFVVALGIGVRRALRRVGKGERAAAVGLLALPVAFGLHSLLDYDLDFLAVAAPTGLVAAALLGAGLPSALVRSRGFIVAAAVVIAAVSVWVLVVPGLAARAVERAYRQVDASDLSAAAASARRAQSLNPLSPDALYARATVASRAGDDAAAERFLEQATRLQPENPDTWYQLGLFRQIELGDQCGAYRAFNEAYTLDPRSSRFAPGGALDIARDAVNDRSNPACGR